MNRLFHFSEDPAIQRFAPRPVRDTFLDLEDAGMWVSRQAVVRLRVDRVADLAAALEGCGTELRIVDSLLPLRDAWKSSVHASGIRLRNAVGWLR